MRTAMSSAGSALHELGLALSLGGTYFGKFHLDPAVKVLSSKEERGRLIATAWGSYLLSDALGLGVSMATWLGERRWLTGRRHVSSTLRTLVRVKDVLMGASIVAIIANAISAALLAREAHGLDVPVETGLTAAPEATPRMVRLQRAMVATSFTQMLATAGAIGVSGLLPRRAEIARV